MNASDGGLCSAHPGGRAHVRVLVLGQDDSQNYISRNSPAFRRVVNELQEQMLSRGFEVVDEDMIAADMDWRWYGRRSRADLLEAANLANDSERARNRVRAILTFGIEANYQRLSFATKYNIHVRGEILDVQSNRFLGSFELPMESTPGPRRCSTFSCASMVIGERARDIAVDIGNVLARKLAYLVDGDGREDDANWRGLDNRYTVTMRNLDTDEAAQIIGVMAEEFPDYEHHELIRRGSAMRKYEYVTGASAAKLERWLTMLLKDMDLDPDRDVELQVRNDSILIQRINGSGNRWKSNRKYD